MRCSKEAFIIRSALVLRWTVVLRQKMITRGGSHRRIPQTSLFDEVWEVLFGIA
jgi:hypothetical protein